MNHTQEREEQMTMKDLTTSEPLLLKPKEAAKLICMSESWLLEHTRVEPVVPHIRFARKVLFRRSDLETFLEANLKVA